MNHLFVIVGCLLVLDVSAVRAGTSVFLGKSVSAWQRELSHHDAAVRRSAAFALGRMGEDARGAVSQLVQRLREDPEASVRDMAASAIGDIARALKDDNATTWKKSGEVLMQLLKDDPSARVRRSAAYALGAFGRRAAGAVGLLAQALGDDQAVVRQNAAWALGQIGEAAGEAVPKLCECLRDQDTLVRRDAAAALRLLGKAGEEAGRPLLDLLKSETDTVVKKTALDTLVRIARPELADAAKELNPLLEDKDPEIRFSAALVLTRIGGEEAVSALPVLQSALKNAESHTQELATAALAALGPLAKSAMYDLADTLVDAKNTVAVRRNAALALAHIGAAAKPVVPALVMALQREQPLEVRQFAAEALAQMQYPANAEAVPALLDAINQDRDPLVRHKCVWALFTLGPAEKFREVGADRALAKLLDETGERTAWTALLRYDAARALAYVLRDQAPDKTVDVLLEMLTNTQLKVYYRTDAEVVGTDTEAMAGRANLQANLGDDARYMAAQALAWLGNKAAKRPDVAAALRKAAQAKEPKLRKTAQEALKDLNL